MSKNIGPHLEKLRMSCGYSLREAAKLSGLSHGYIRDVELSINRKSGTEIIPMPQTLRKYADAYNVDFHELMRIAGHLEELQDDKNYELIEIDLSSVLYVQVNDDNLVNYHYRDYVYTEEKSLHEYMLLEEKLENHQFLRVSSGVYANLNQLRGYDEKNGRLFFDVGLVGVFIEISLMRSAKYNNLISRAVANNNNIAMEFHLMDMDIAQIPMIIKNIVS